MIVANQSLDARSSPGRGKTRFGLLSSLDRWQCAEKREAKSHDRYAQPEDINSKITSLPMSLSILRLATRARPLPSAALPERKTPANRLNRTPSRLFVSFGWNCPHIQTLRERPYNNISPGANFLDMSSPIKTLRLASNRPATSEFL